MSSTNKPLLKIANIILLLVNLATVSSSHRYHLLSTLVSVKSIPIAPDGSHLVAVNLFFLNLADYTSGHCMVDLDYMIR